MKKVNKFVFWTPRILAIIFILFLAVFSLDVFDSCHGFLDCTLGLLIHNIPVLILIAVLVISWKYEIVGGVGFILGGILYIANLVISGIINHQFHWYFLSWSLTIAGPAFLVGVLFLVNWYKKKK